MAKGEGVTSALGRHWCGWRRHLSSLRPAHADAFELLP